MDPHELSSDRMHRAVYGIVLALGLLLILSIADFAVSGQGWVIATVACLFVAAAFGVVAIMGLLARRRDEPRPGASDERLRGWLAGRFETQSGTIAGREAAIGLLLPVAAVCVGMAVFVTVLHFTVPNESLIDAPARMAAAAPAPPPSAPASAAAKPVPDTAAKPAPNAAAAAAAKPAANGQS